MLKELLLAGTAALAAPALAAEPAPLAAHGEPYALEDLERAFWYCDYIATTKGVLAAPMGACRFATEELKNAKFGGDFNALLVWWRDNKREEHGKLERLLPR